MRSIILVSLLLSFSVNAQVHYDKSEWLRNVLTSSNLSRIDKMFWTAAGKTSCVKTIQFVGPYPAIAPLDCNLNSIQPKNIFQCISGLLLKRCRIACGTTISYMCESSEDC